MADEQVRIDVDVADNASERLHAVADDVRALDDTNASVEVDANTREVQDDIERVKREVGLLDDKTATVEVDADVSGAQRAFKGLDDSHPGKAVGETFVRDITGAMGDSASQVGGVFADVTAGIETSFETLSGRIGGTAGDIIGKLGGAFTTALGVGGVAFVAVNQLYDWWQHRNDEQKKQIEDTYNTLKDQAGDTAATLDKTLGEALEKLNGKQRDALIGAGVNMKDLAAIMRGETVPQYQALIDKHAEYEAALQDIRTAQNTGHREQMANAQAAIQALQGSEDQYQLVNDLLHDQGGAIQGAIDKYNDLAQLMGRPLAPRLDTHIIEQQMADLANKALSLGGLFNFSPSSVAGANALDTRRQGPR